MQVSQVRRERWPRSSSHLRGGGALRIVGLAPEELRRMGRVTIALSVKEPEHSEGALGILPFNVNP